MVTPFSVVWRRSCSGLVGDRRQVSAGRSWLPLLCLWNAGGSGRGSLVPHWTYEKWTQFQNLMQRLRRAERLLGLVSKDASANRIEKGWNHFNLVSFPYSQLVFLFHFLSIYLHVLLLFLDLPCPRNFSNTRFYHPRKPSLFFLLLYHFLLTELILKFRPVTSTETFRAQTS